MAYCKKRIMRHIDKIIIHCTDTPVDRKVTKEDIWQWHTAPKPIGRGWKVPGYHFLIHQGGEVEAIIDLDKIANGCKGYNAHSIHICLVGGRGEKDKLFTQQQFYGLKKIISEIIYQEGKNIKIYGHYELDNKKTCPNFDVQEWIKKWK